MSDRDCRDTRADGHGGTSPAMLYNLAADIGETEGLAGAEPEKLKEFQTRWDLRKATLAKPLWGEEPGGSPPRRAGE